MTMFRTSRHFNASPEVVFAAIGDPVRLARWWGPDGFTNSFERFEFRPGGHWQFVMHGPNGANFRNESEFVEVVPNALVRIRHLSKPHYELAVKLIRDGDGTLVSWEQEFADAAVAERVRHIVEPSNEQNLDRLGREIGEHSRSNPAPTLREAVADDFATIVAWIPDAAAALYWAGPGVVFPCSASDLERQIQLQAGSNLVLESGGVAVAFGQYWSPVSGTVHLARLIVGPAFRGRGFGRELCLQLIAAGTQATGATRITLRVNRNNDPALSLYRSLGFEIVPAESDEQGYFMRRDGA